MPRSSNGLLPSAYTSTTLPISPLTHIWPTSHISHSSKWWEVKIMKLLPYPSEAQIFSSAPYSQTASD
jgi:hypothetical protein